MQYRHFIILDDDPLSSLLNELMVQHAGEEMDTVTFHDPVACLRHIRTTPLRSDGYTCLLLDINMPKLTGWDFLAELDRLPVNIQHRFSVVMVTSSLHPDNLELVQKYPLVIGYLQKPVSVERFRQLLDHLDLRASA
jgi:CheY-like chemotaxis protein